MHVVDYILFDTHFVSSSSYKSAYPQNTCCISFSNLDCIKLNWKDFVSIIHLSRALPFLLHTDDQIRENGSELNVAVLKQPTKLIICELTFLERFAKNQTH